MTLDSLFNELPPLDTNRFRLRPAGLAAAEKIAARLCPTAIPWQCMAQLPDHAPAATESNLMIEPFSVHHLPPWRVERAASREVVGVCVFLTWSIPDARAELSCIFTPSLDFDDRRELLGALLDFGFTTIGLNRIECRCATDDTAMTQLYEAAGMQPEAILRQQVNALDRFHDMRLYSMLRGDR